MFAALVTRFAPYRALALLALLGSLVLCIYVQSVRLDAERETSAGRLSTIRAFETSNAALRADALQREKASRAASAQAARQAANARRQIESIQSAPVPEDCAGSIQWMVDQGPGVEGQP